MKSSEVRTILAIAVIAWEVSGFGDSDPDAGDYQNGCDIKVSGKSLSRGRRSTLPS
jgi:hypothetical protein